MAGQGCKKFFNKDYCFGIPKDCLYVVRTYIGVLYLVIIISPYSMMVGEYQHRDCHLCYPTFYFGVIGSALFCAAVAFGVQSTQPKFRADSRNLARIGLVLFVATIAECTIAGLYYPDSISREQAKNIIIASSVLIFCIPAYILLKYSLCFLYPLLCLAFGGTSFTNETIAPKVTDTEEQTHDTPQLEEQRKRIEQMEEENGELKKALAELKGKVDNMQEPVEVATIVDELNTK